MADEKNTSQSTLDENTKKQVKSAAANFAATAAVAMAMSLGAEALIKLLATNRKEYKPTGDTVVTATKDETVFDKKETSANSNEASLAKDDVQAQQGSVQASDTDAQAAKSDARAADTGASAMKTKAGAMDVATKALKIN